MARMDLLRHKDDDFYCRLIVIDARWNSLNKSGSLILEFGILVLKSVWRVHLLLLWWMACRNLIVT